MQKYLNDEFTEYELINAVFEPFEQVNQGQAQLLGTTFEMLSGGPAQTNVGTGGGGSSSDMPWGEKNKHGGKKIVFQSSGGRNKLPPETIISNT